MAVAGAGLSSMIANSYGAILTKANNTTPMNQAASWVPSTAAPTAADTIVFDHTVQAGNTAETLGGALSVAGIQLLDPAGAISITDTNALSIGAGGIDMSLASQNLSLALPVTLTAAQTWVVGGGVTLTDSGTIDTTGGTLSVAGSGNATLSGAITGSNGLTVMGAGTVTLSSAETYSGATTINGGVLSLASGSSINASSPLVMSSGTLKTNGSSVTFANSTFNAGVSNLDAGGGTMNLGAITQNLGGAVRFAPNSTYTSPTSVSKDGTDATYYTTLGLTDAATTDDNGNIVGGDSISGYWLVGTPSPGAQRFIDPGDIQLDLGSVSGLFRSNTSTPTINIMRFNSPQGGFQTGRDGNNGPVFVVRNTNVVNFNEILVTPNVGAEDVFITDDATINNTGPRANGNLVLWQNNTQGFLVFNVGIGSTGFGFVTKAGAGTVIMNGTNSYIGSTVAAEGTLEIGNLRGLSSSTFSGLIMSGGNVLSLINLAATNTGLVGDTAKAVTLNSTGTLAAVTGDFFALPGVISGAGGINIGMGAVDATANPGRTQVVHTTVNGNGTVVFTAANTYSGPTEVNFGTLQISNTSGSGTGTGNVIVDSGAILGGSGIISGNVKVFGAIAPGDAVNISGGDPVNVGTLTIGGKLTLASGGVINYEPGGDLISAHGVSIADPLAKINLFTAGVTIPYFFGGTFQIINDVGASASDMAALLAKFNTSAILNAQPASAGYSYTFQTSGTILSLTIVSPVISSNWIGSDGNWNTTEEGNWTKVLTSPARTTAIPQNALDSANFTGGGSSNVAIGSAITVGTINLTGKSYNISLGAGGSLTLDNVAVDAQINDNGASQTISANMTVKGGLRLNVVNSSDVLTLSGAVSATGLNITKVGNGTAVFTGTDTYANTIIQGGTLQIGNNTATGNLGTGTVTDNGLLVFKRSDASLTISNAISGTGIVQQSGSGTLTLAGANTYSGGTNVNSGVVKMGNVGALGTGLLSVVGSSIVDVNGLAATFGGITGTGIITNSAAGNTTITINTGANRTFGGRIAESSGKGLIAFVKTGGGELNMTNLSTYTGGTFITGGSIVLNPQGQASGTSIPTTITTSSSGQVHVIDGLVANNNININGGAVDPVNFDTTTSAAASATLTGSITSTGVYQMGVASDFGTLTLTGANTGKGNVANLSEGNIIFSDTGSLQVLANGSTLGGAIRIGTASNATVTVQNGASISTTAVSGDGLILGTGGIGDPNFSSPQTLNINGGTVDIGTSTLNIQGSSFNTFTDNYVNSVVNLNANGVLRLAEIRQQIGSNTQLADFNFNGGTLVATANARLFDTSTGATIAQVFSGGAIINVDQTLVAGNLTDINATLGHRLDSGAGNDGGLTKTGHGTLTISNNNLYNGATTVLGGDLFLTSGTGSPLGASNAALTIAAGAQLDLNNQNLNQITSLNGGGGIVQDSSGTVTLTFGNSNASGTFSGGVSNGAGKINMVKTGNGTQTFSGSNQYGSLTITSGAVLAGASGTLDQGTIIVNSNSGLEIGDGVSVSGNIFTNVTGEFENVPTGNGTISGPVTVQTGSYVVGISGSGSLTLANTQNLGGTTTATVDRGNVILGGFAQFLASTATFTDGGSTFTTPVAFTVQDSASLSFGNIVLGGSAAQAVTFNVAGGFVNTNTGTFNLLSGAATGSTVNLTGGNVTTTGFTKTATAASTLNWNGGTITAAGNSTTFLPALTGLSVKLGTAGGTFNDNAKTVTIGANLTGVTGDGGFRKSGSGTTTLSGNLNYSGTTTVGGGTLAVSGTNTIGAVAGSTPTTGTFSVTGGSTTSQGITTNALNVSGGALTIGTSGTQTARTSKVNSLTVTGGTVNIGDNHFIHESTAANLSTNYANDKALVASGALTSSTLTSNTALAVAEAGNISAYSSPGATFGGVSTDANSILITRALKGDGDLNGTVDLLDFIRLQTGFGSSGAGARWDTGDYNQDGTVNLLDFIALQTNFGQSLTLSDMPAIVAAPSVAPVPEPMSIAILGLGAVALLRRRRK
jgi:autotransporter-associated beta strand protein